MLSDSGVVIARGKPVREILDTPTGREFVRRISERFAKSMDDAAFAYLISKKP